MLQCLGMIFCGAASPEATTTEGSLESRSVCTRAAHLDDAPQMAELSSQLGYPVTACEVRSRLDSLVCKADQLILVAEGPEGQVVGWLHATVTRSLVVESAASIAGLVVDEHFRRKGVARSLMRQAEAWTLSQGVKSVSLRTNVARNAAHMFYEQLGYQRVKTQHVYRKLLGA